MLVKNLIVVIGSLLALNSANATVLSLDGEFAKGATSATVGIDYSAQTISNQALQFGGVGAYAGGDSVKTENSSTKDTTTTKTQNAGASVRFQTYDFLKTTISGSTTQTPETKYKESGGQIKFDGKINGTWSLGLLTGKSSIEQKYSLTILSKTYEREVTLDKQYAGLSVGFSLEDVFHIKLSGTVYSYSKSKTDLQTAYQNQFLNNYITDLVSSISGLPESTASADMTYVYSDDIELSLYLQSSKLIVDDSNTQRIELMVTKYFETVTGGIGIGQSRSKEGSSGSLLVSLGYDF